MNRQRKQQKLLGWSFRSILILVCIVIAKGCVMALPPHGALSKNTINEEWAVRYGWGIGIIYPFGEYHSSGGLGWSGISLYRNVNGKWKHWVVLNKWTPFNDNGPLTYYGKLIWHDDKYVYLGVKEGDHFFDESGTGWPVITLYKVDLMKKRILQSIKFCPQGIPLVGGCNVGCIFERHDDNMIYILLDDYIYQTHPDLDVKMIIIDAKLEKRIMCSTLLNDIDVKYERGNYKNDIYIDLSIDENDVNVKWIDKNDNVHEKRFNIDEMAYEDCTVDSPTKGR